MTGCIAETMNEAVGLNNQFTGANRYDAAGNTTSNGAYVFDAENRITSGGGLTFQYDGDGNRVWKTGTTNELYWRGTGADALAESDAAGNLTSEYIFFGGKRVARFDIPNSSVHYYISDHLGSATVIGSASGAVEREEMYYPYGGERWTNGSDPNHYKFTGKERDAESGLDNFGARYFASTMGRFLTPDWSALPAAVPYADLSNPQSLNRYSYVQNNPTTTIDADGHLTISEDGWGHKKPGQQEPLSTGENPYEDNDNREAQNNSDPTTPPPPPTPKPPALVEYNGHIVTDPNVKKALSEISVYTGSSTVNVISGDRNFVPTGGAKNSAHLTGQAADFHIVGMKDSKADAALKGSGSPIKTGFRLIQHGPNTITQGAHLHLDSRNQAGQPTVFMHEGMTPKQSGVYSHDED
ncbi:MAG: RHS repeat-associated core domain-containing protein [Terriglobales bacterium]|jgi:RHS repeat-associated protein